MVQSEILDALIVGAGFSGLASLYKLREAGFSVQIYETGPQIGGTWFWNRYPGARVDSAIPTYQLPTPKETWEDFQWTEKFPGRDELQRYFRHIDNKLGLSKDIRFNTTVTDASFEPEKNCWKISTQSGLFTLARHLILCTGFSVVKYTPDIKGIESFQGKWVHSADWPENERVDWSGKRVAVIGTGATGVQIIQEIGPKVGHLTVFQRNPAYAIPMRQAKIGEQGTTTQNVWIPPKKDEIEGILSQLPSTFAATGHHFPTKGFHDSTPSERNAVFEALWAEGGFGLWLAVYFDTFMDLEANQAVYTFWREKIHAKLNDTVKKEILAPSIPPYSYGTKRVPLEQNYYEVFNQPNVDLVNLKESPIIEITSNGIRTKQQGLIEDIDVIIFATGFDAVTGGILKINITNGENLTLKQKWGDGVTSNFGMTTNGFPNLYWLYGPQAPTAFSSGPICGDIQSTWIIDLIIKMRQDGNILVETTKDAENEWVKQVQDAWAGTLCPSTNSWYQGANIPGKRVEPLNYFGGIPAYLEALKRCKDNNYTGFIFV